LSKNQLLTLLIVVGLLAGIATFVQRYVAEAHNRRVELVIDYGDAQALANTSARAMDDVLTQLNTAGVTTVAVTEDTLSTLVSNDVILTPKRDGDTTLLTFAPGFPGQMQRVQDMLAHKAPGLAVSVAGPSTLRVGAPWPQFSGIPIGLDDRSVETVRRNGLLVAPRLSNYTGVTADNIRWELQQTRDQCTPQSMGPLIFAGAAVLGSRTQIEATKDAIESLGLTYGSVEFGKTLGDDELSRSTADRTVRVHSIGNDEMGQMDEPTAIERFVRGAKERNIRVCYIRLFLNGLTTEPGQNVLDANVSFIGKIAKGMLQVRTSTSGHLLLGQAHPFDDDPTPGLIARELMGLGVAAGVLFLIRLFTGLRDRAFWASLGVGIVVGMILAAPSHAVKGREILALLSACTFPTLGLCAYALPAAVPESSLSQILKRAFAAYARMTLATLAGIVLVVGLLSGRLFLLKVDEFLGVKLVLVAPILLTLGFYGLGLDKLSPNAGWGPRRARIEQTLRGLYDRPLIIGEVVLGLVVLVAFALLVARSGNDPGVGVSAAELKMRALLDKYLLVRPRTKEFLLGHPALFFALAASASGRFPKWILPLIVVGAIGQASLMDTFCHLHTPLLISFLHALIGWVLGAGFGILAFVIVSRIVPKAVPVPAAAEEAYS
jgi:hypothetical protein